MNFRIYRTTVALSINLVTVMTFRFIYVKITTMDHLKLLGDISSPSLKNTLRGAISNDADSFAAAKTLANARAQVNHVDIKAFSKLIADAGLDRIVYGDPFPATASELLVMWKTYDPLPVELELEVQTHRIQNNLPKLTSAITSICKLNEHIWTNNIPAAIAAINDIVRDFGHSITIIRKILYLHSRSQLDTQSTQKLNKKELSDIQALMESIFSTRKGSVLSLHNNLLFDLLDNRSALFETIFAQEKIHQRPPDNINDYTFRLPLVSKFRFPCFTEYRNVPEIVYASGCSSIIDIFLDFCCFNMTDVKDGLFEDNEEIEKIRRSLTNTPIFEDTDHLANHFVKENWDEEIYKLSSAIPESEKLFTLRQSLDCILVRRLNFDLKIDSSKQLFFQSGLHITNIHGPQTSTLSQIDHYSDTESPVSLRTFATIHLLENGHTLADLNSEQVRSLLGNTENLSSLLSIDQILQIHDSGSEEERPIISFLALVILNDRDPSDDREFELRFAFQSILTDRYNSKIVAFLEWLFERTPSLCDPVIHLCSIDFLEKLYLIFDSYEEALGTRIAIFKWAAEELDNSTYTSMAEQLTSDEKIREIRGELDDSRIYVDEIRFRQWLSDNVLDGVRRYQRNIEFDNISNTPTQPLRKDNKNAIEFLGASIYFYDVISRAFEEFCLNRLFGIDLSLIHI